MNNIIDIFSIDKILEIIHKIFETISKTDHIVVTLSFIALITIMVILTSNIPYPANIVLVITISVIIGHIYITDINKGKEIAILETEINNLQSKTQEEKLKDGNNKLEKEIENIQNKFRKEQDEKIKAQQQIEKLTEELQKIQKSTSMILPIPNIPVVSASNNIIHHVTNLLYGHTAWNSGGHPPQWIEIDFNDNKIVSSIT